LVRPDQRSHLGFSLVFQAVRDAEAIGQWAVLPQLPLAFEPMNRQPEPLMKTCDEIPWRVARRPRHGPALLETVG